MVKFLCSNFRVIKVNFYGVPKFWKKLTIDNLDHVEHRFCYAEVSKDLWQLVNA